MIRLIEQGAMGLANRTLPLALYTDDQQKGRGQQGNDWNSEAGKNITITVAFPLGSAEHIDLVQLNKTLSVSVLLPIQKLVIESMFLKWPNDIVTETKKLGGLLMEMTQISQQKFLLLGIGINVNQLNWQNQHKATSLAMIQGEAFDRDKVMDSMLFSLDDSWKNGKDLYSEYRKSLWKLGEQVILENQPDMQQALSGATSRNGVVDETIGLKDEIFDDFGKVQGLLIDVDSLGRIVIEDGEGKLLAFHHGQVRLQF
jgi:BirA family biotin operon repressor/biotin-[acetyl-CoA-carboxylase] ligase